MVDSGIVRGARTVTWPEVALVISTIRKKWYRNYMSILNTLTECVLEVVEERPEDEACE